MLRWELQENRLTQALQAVQKKGVEILDLTELNPTQVGLTYPPHLLAELADPSILSYHPSPQGLLSARQAVASIYAQKGIRLNPEEIVLTASTSEAYSFLFRLLAEAGDAVLTPQPGYPLLEYLAGLNHLELTSYPLRYQGRWQIDVKVLEARLTERVKAIVLIHPNHPTGNGITRQELEEILSLARRRQMPLIADEVFAEYLFKPNDSLPLTLAGGEEVLTFSLGGISKFLGLPQMKLAWCAVTGPKDQVRSACEKLELIADTYLSVNTPVQSAFPKWLACAEEIQSQIRNRLERNRHFLQGVFRHVAGAELLQAEGGWSAVLRVPAIADEEEFLVRLLEQERLFIHPGYFFDFEESGFLVVSLLTPPARLERGIRILLKSAASS